MADDNLQRMYEYQELKGNSGSEYVVRGAEVVCGYGGSSCVLNLPSDHGVYTSDGRPLITVSDTKAENIKGFGTCKINKRNSYRCELKLGTWSVVSNKDMKIKDPATGKIEYAVECSATALCLKGGVVKFKTSGQTSPSYKSTKISDAVEIVEDVKGSWTRTSNNKDFLGYIKIINPGLYNFGIGFQGDSAEKVIGSIFVYEPDWGKLKFVGSYKINLCQSGNYNGFKWKYAADIELNFNRYYYFEIDCPILDKYEYILTGNQERISIAGDIGLAKWVLSDNCKDWFTRNVGFFTMKKHIIYLDEIFTFVLFNSLLEFQFRKRKKEEIGNVIASAIKTIGITMEGIENTNLGIFATVCNFIIVNFNKSEIDTLCEQLLTYIDMEIWEADFVRIVLYEENSRYAEMTNNAVYPRTEVSLWNSFVAYGEKYTWGECISIKKMGDIGSFRKIKSVIENEIINQDDFLK